ncbi:MAG: efflux RND transporter periplasmic adaptor subunit [Coxiellaceae bacterium]|nr:efflux RND transporter periplasmic adaptor subunit [Coxiellaceae bacterium]
MKLTRQKIIVTTLILAVFIALILFFHERKNNIAAISSIPVQVENPIQRSLPHTETTTGYLIAKENTNITPLASGYVRNIHFHEGQLVQKGSILFELDDDTQKNALASAQAAAKLSDFQYRRDKNLLQRGFITQEMLYTAKATNQQNQAALQTAQTNFSERIITAPFAGTAGAITTSIGDYISPGTVLTTLVNNQDLRVQYTLPAKILNDLQVNQPVLVQSSTGNIKINAAVSYISAAIDQSSQTIAVHAKIDNAKNLFKPGEYVTITQSLGNNENTLLLPEQSVLASIDGYSVFTVQNNHAVRTSVKIGDRIDGNVIIESGLSAKDAVIIAGQNEVKDNQAVSIQPPTEIRTSSAHS